MAFSELTSILKDLADYCPSPHIVVGENESGDKKQTFRVPVFLDRAKDTKSFARVEKGVLVETEVFLVMEAYF